jgi:hypothetical protein
MRTHLSTAVSFSAFISLSTALVASSLDRTACRCCHPFVDVVFDVDGAGSARVARQGREETVVVVLTELRVLMVRRGAGQTARRTCPERN